MWQGILLPRHLSLLIGTRLLGGEGIRRWSLSEPPSTITTGLRRRLSALPSSTDGDSGGAAARRARTFFSRLNPASIFAGQGQETETAMSEQDAKKEAELADNGVRESPLPEAFQEFLRRNGVDPAVYSVVLPRYIRVKPEASSAIPEIEEELRVKLSPLPWIPGFYSLPSDVHISGTKAYDQGKIYGMDAASGAAVAALDISPGDDVLDLCAAPGAKLCMIADLLQDSGTLTAVDISRSRLAASRTMLRKYKLGSRCRLFLADGTAFSLLPLSCRRGAASQTDDRDEELEKKFKKLVNSGEKFSWNDLYVNSKRYGEWKAKTSARERKAAKKLQTLEDALDRVGGREAELIYYGSSSGVVGKKVSEVFGNSCPGEALDNGYDKVLVDAECTHDGSLKHICKYERWGWDTFEKRFFNPERIATITSLQLNLLSNGFRLLKVGGALVYSTCSFTTAQNEDVVEKFLASHPNSVLQEIEQAELWPCGAGGVEHSIRFDPQVSKTSGLFIAKISRLRS